MSTTVAKWNEGLSNRVSIIIRRYIDHMRFAAYMVVSFINFFSYYFGSTLYHCIYDCMFCMLLFNFVNYVLLFLCIHNVMFMYSYCYVYVFLLLCMFCSGCSVSLCSFVCKYVLYYRHRVSTQLHLTNISYLVLS